MNAIVETVRGVVRLLVEGQWETLERLTSGCRLSAPEIESAVHDYGRTLVAPPDDALRNHLNVVEVNSAAQRTFDVRVPLWTHEEGRSDLELGLTLKEVGDGIYGVEIDSLHVP